MQCVVGHYLREELGPFCWSMLVAGIAVFGASHRLAEHTSQKEWFHQDSESCSGSDWQQTTKQWPWPYFWCKFDIGKYFEVSSRSIHWPGHHWLSYKIHLSSHIWLRNRLSLLHRIRRDDTSKWWFFLFLVSPWGTHLLSFSTFPVCFKCQMTIEWSVLSSSATSHVVLTGSTSVMALSSSLTFDGRPQHSWSSRLSSPLKNPFNQHCTVHLLAVHGPNALLMWVVSTALWPILKSNKKNHLNLLFV